MIDPNENIIFDPNYLVDVRALVMVRDDSTGGWIPMSGGGLSKVSVRKGVFESDPDPAPERYILHAQRLSDESIILRCLIKKDYKYNRVMPTFHHWTMAGTRFGLTFQTSADGKAFARGLRDAVNEVIKDDDDVDDEVSPSSPTNRESELDDDKSLDFSDSDLDPHSASDLSVRDTSQTTPQEQAAQTSNLFSTDLESGSPTQSKRHDNLRLPAEQQCAYAGAEGTRLAQQESAESVKIKGTEAAPRNAERASTSHKKTSGRHRCRYCHEIYVEEDNKRGACEYAPDCVRTTIDEVSCVRAARCMMYHCMSDEEGEFAQHPCECTCGNGSNSRWLGLAFLSIFVPCLCLFPPLRSCHWCCVRVGLCGGRHRSAS